MFAPALTFKLTRLAVVTLAVAILAVMVLELVKLASVLTVR
mgnify:CR=1 FL=1